MLDMQAVFIIMTFLLVITIAIFGLLFFNIVGKKPVRHNIAKPTGAKQRESLIDRLNSLNISSLKLAKFAEGCLEIAKYKEYCEDDTENTFSEDYEFGRTFYYKSEFLKNHDFMVDFNRVAKLEDEFFENYKKLCNLRAEYNVYSGAQLTLPVLIELHKTTIRMENFLLSLNRRDYSDDSDQFLIDVIRNNFLTPCGV